MSISRIAGASVTQTAERLSATGAVGQFIRNTGAITKNAGLNLLQDTKSLQSNSLIMSSLALVISRILIANFSAVQSKGTKDSAYRHREAIRTDIREVCGFTFGFIVLRQIQKWIAGGVKWAFGIKDKIKFGEEVAKAPGLLRQFWDASAAALQRKKHTVMGPIMDTAPITEFVFKNEGLFKKLEPILRRIPGNANRPAAQIVQSLYHWAPIVVGSIPATLLAGYALERFTRDYSDDVVGAISKKLNRDKTPHSETGEAEAKVPAASAVNVRFDSFVSRVHQKQSERVADQG